MASHNLSPAPHHPVFFSDPLTICAAGNMVFWQLISSWTHSCPCTICLLPLHHQDTVSLLFTLIAPGLLPGLNWQGPSFQNPPAPIPTQEGSWVKVPPLPPVGAFVTQSCNLSSLHCLSSPLGCNSSREEPCLGVTVLGYCPVSTPN
jgi:hypothetical protein